MITFRINKETKQGEIVKDGQVLEVCAIGDVARRLSWHRHQAAQQTGVRFVTVERPYKRNRAA